jgi:hypothetical protein
MRPRFSVSTFSIPAQAVYSQPSDSTAASFTGMVNSSSHSSGRVVGKPEVMALVPINALIVHVDFKCSSVATVQQTP